MAYLAALVVPLLLLVPRVHSHARFLEPPSRASMWRMGFEAPVDYQDHEGSCGGLFYQWLANGGRCGICGDRWDEWPRPHEMGGRFATGGIVRRYRRGQIISTVVEVTTAHRGYMEFRICKLSPGQPEASQSCLNKNLLRLADGSGTKYRVGDKSTMARIRLRLPRHLACSRCVIQWRYRTGNNWGICPDGSSQLGCGPQEEFRGCADVSILESAAAGGTTPPGLEKHPFGDVRDPFADAPAPSPAPRGHAERPVIPTGAGRTPTERPRGTEGSLSLQRLRPVAARPDYPRVRYGAPPRRNRTEAGPAPDTGFIDTDDLDEIDLTELDQLPPVFGLDDQRFDGRFDGSDNSIDDSRSNTLRLASSLRRGKQLFGSNDLESALAAADLTAADLTCHAIGIWVTVPGMDTWCQTNCLARPLPSCPDSMCACRRTQDAPVTNEGLRSTLEVVQGSLPETVPDPSTVQALLTELAHLRSQRNGYREQSDDVRSSRLYQKPDRDEMDSRSDSAAPRPGRNFYFAPPPTSTTTTTITAERMPRPTVPLTPAPPVRPARPMLPQTPVELPAAEEDDEVERFPEALPNPREPIASDPVAGSGPEPDAELIPAALLVREQLRGRIERLKFQRQQAQQRQRQMQEQEQQEQRRKQLEQQRQLLLIKERSQEQRKKKLIQTQKKLKQQLLLQRQRQQQQAQRNKEGGEAKWETNVQCTAVVPWRFMSGVTKWCNDNCLDKKRPSCPVTICACTNAKVTIRHPEVADGRNRTLLQITHQGNRAKIVLNAGAADGSEESGEASKNTTLYFKAKAPGFLFFIQPIERDGRGVASKTARAIVVPMGQKIGRSEARRRATELLRRSQSSPAPDTEASATRRLQEEVYRKISMLKSTEVVPLNRASGLDHDPPGDAASSVEGSSGRADVSSRDRAVEKRQTTCRGAGSWRHSFAMDYWCEVNCTSEKVQNCPKSLCECRGYARLQDV